MGGKAKKDAQNAPGRLAAVTASRYDGHANAEAANKGGLG